MNELGVIGIGSFFESPIQTPALGAMMTYTIPPQFALELISLDFRLSNSAQVATRIVMVQRILTAFNIQLLPCSAGQIANEVFTYSLYSRAANINGFDGGTRFAIQTGRLIFPPSAVISTVVTGIQTGDQFDRGFICGIAYPLKYPFKLPA